MGRNLMLVKRSQLNCDRLEARDVPAAFPIPANAVAISPDDGGIPIVKIVDPTTGEDIGQVQAFEDSFRGGVHTVLGDVNGDGVRDLIIAPGQGGGPRIRIIDGQTGGTLRDSFVYEPQYTGGIYVALGDINDDGRQDIITGTGVGGGPRVRVLDGKSLGQSTLKDFFAYEDTFRGGVLVSSGDTNGDGVDDIITGTGVGGGPRVQVFSGKDDRVLRNFFAYEDTFRGGVLVASGDTNGDGRDDIITGTGPGGGPVVKVISGANGDSLSTLLTDDPSFRGGVRVESRDVNGDGRDDVITHLRHGNDDTLRVFSGANSQFVSAVSRVVDDNPKPKNLPTINPNGVVAGTTTNIGGVLVATNATAKTVTVRLANGSNVVVQAGAGTEIHRDKVNATLSDFQAGDKIEAVIGTNGTAWEIEAKSAAFVEGQSGKTSSTGSTTIATAVEGSIVAVDVNGQTVSIRDQSGKVTIVSAGVGTKIERNGLNSTLATFVVGDAGEAKIGTNGIALQIEATSVTAPPTVPPTVPPTSPPPAPPAGTANPAANSSVEGSVTAIDANAGSVTIRTQAGTQFLVRTTSSTKVERNGNSSTLSAFRVGDFGQAKIGSDGRATKLEATQV